MFWTWSLYFLCSGRAKVDDYLIVKRAVALFRWPRSSQITVAVPPLPFEPIVQDQFTLPLLPTVFADPSNERGREPVE
jgi:hypothetical protein